MFAVTLTYVEQAKQARGKLAEEQTKKNVTSSDEMQACMKGVEKQLALVDPTWRLEMNLVGQLSGDGASARAARAMLGIMPDKDRQVTITEAIAGVQKFIADPCNKMAPAEVQSSVKAVLSNNAKTSPAGACRGDE